MFDGGDGAVVVAVVFVVIRIWLFALSMSFELVLVIGNDVYAEDGTVVNIKSFVSKVMFDMRRFLSADG